MLRGDQSDPHCSLHSDVRVGAVQATSMDPEVPLIRHRGRKRRPLRVLAPKHLHKLTEIEKKKQAKYDSLNYQVVEAHYHATLVHNDPPLLLAYFE